MTTKLSSYSGFLLINKTSDLSFSLMVIYDKILPIGVGNIQDEIIDKAKQNNDRQKRNNS